MKKVAIIYRDKENQPAIQYIENDIMSVFRDYIEIQNYYLDNLSEGELIEADAYLVCYEEMMWRLVNHITDFSKLIVITRSIKKKYLDDIRSIPQGTNVLVVNDSEESILQTTYIIYALGIGHLNLIPFDAATSAEGGYSHIDEAIVARYSEHLIPAHITKVHNIQNREVSFETCKKLINLLGLEKSPIQRNLIQKVSNEVSLEETFIQSYFNNFLKDWIIEKLLENSLYIVILLDSKGVIQYFNEPAYKAFHLNVGDIFHDETYFGIAANKEGYCKDVVLNLNADTYLLNIEPINYLGEVLGRCVILQGETDLKNTENDFYRKLKQRGFVAKHNFDDIVAVSQSMKDCISIAKKVSPSDLTVLINGESGTGKELIAQSIHNHSTRSKYPFVAVNCAALPETLLESELFGYEAGAFTGANKNGKMGLFEHAQKGTIFLDEIGDISSNMQSRLLRVLQEHQILRIGGEKIIDIDVRIIAATNVDLEKKVQEGKFRIDLFYRLNMISLHIPPLRERKDDILPLLDVFMGKRYYSLTDKEISNLLAYNWPGNVREAENVAEYYKLLNELPAYFSANKKAVSGSDAAGAANPNSVRKNNHNPDVYSVEELKKEILQVMADCSSSFAGLGRKMIRLRLEESGIQVGEGFLKKILYELRDDGLIVIRPGRLGSYITEQGLEAAKQGHCM